MARRRQVPLPGFGRRLRAAIVLTAGAEVEISRLKDDLARELNFSVRTLDRLINEQRWPNDFEIERLGTLLDVPAWFLERGFEEDAESSQLGALTGTLMTALDRKIDELSPRLSAIEAAIHDLAARLPVER